jgi:hypothetical protein
MGLLSRKPKTSIEEFCQQFYDSVVFHPIIAGEDFNKIWWDTVFDSVAEADKSFAVIDKTLFIREMTALRLELFGLAWRHKFKREKFTIPQSAFTRKYLEENEKLDIWDIMGEYNQAVAQSATLTETGELVKGRVGRAQITFTNVLRANMFDKWAETNISDPSAPTEEEKMLADCVARVANRIGADIKRNDCILVKRLTARLADRLGCDVNLKPEAFLKLGAVIFGLYNGAKEAIKSVNI